MKILDLLNFGSGHLNWSTALQVCLISFHQSQVFLTAVLGYSTYHKTHPFEVVQFNGYLV